MPKAISLIDGFYSLILPSTLKPSVFSVQNTDIAVFKECPFALAQQQRCSFLGQGTAVCFYLKEKGMSLNQPRF